jgi:hypothetical protein
MIFLVFMEGIIILKSMITMSGVQLMRIVGNVQYVIDSTNIKRSKPMSEPNEIDDRPSRITHHRVVKRSEPPYKHHWLRVKRSMQEKRSEPAQHIYYDAPICPKCGANMLALTDAWKCPDNQCDQPYIYKQYKEA